MYLKIDGRKGGNSVNSANDGRAARWLGHALLVPVWIVVLGLLGFVIARVVAFDHDHLFYLADSYTLWILLPAYPITVSALCFRAWPLAVAAGVIVIAHLVWVIPPTFSTVPVTAAAEHAPHVRIASANVRYDNLDHKPLLAELNGTHADVIVMEEVTPAWWKAIVASGLLQSHPVVAKVVRARPGRDGDPVTASAHARRRPPRRWLAHHHRDGRPRR